MLQKLQVDFFARPAVVVAEALLGATLVRQWRGRELRAKLVEIEAYLGPHDLAAHASRGRTARTSVLFGPPGRAYVYFIYGMHEMLNIVAGQKGEAQSVLIRAADPLEGWHADLSGPGKLTRAMHISRAQNGTPVTGQSLYLLPRTGPAPQVARSPRIGVDYAKEWRDVPLRFFDANSTFVSRRPRPCREAT